METATVVQAIESGNPQEGWAVFHFNPSSAWYGMFWKIFMAMIGFGIFYVFNYLPKTIPETTEMKYLSVVFGIVGVISLIAIAFSIRMLVLGKKTFIVLTRENLVRSLCGKVSEFPLKSLTELQLITSHGYGVMPQYQIMALDLRINRRVEIAFDRIWGSEPELFNILKTRVSL